ncbi:MAG: hypothetical protein U5K69_09380 [Balneolaceae bacterium]|nr:hypothetical protein [Balneolaceae bacterium]
MWCRNAEQSTQNAKAADLELTSDELEFINKQIDELELETA